MSLEAISKQLAESGIDHVVVSASSGLPAKITAKQWSGFKSAMSGSKWSGNDNWNKMTYGIDSPLYYLLKDICSQLGGSDGWRGLNTADINNAIKGDKVMLTYYTPSEHVKKMFGLA